MMEDRLLISATHPILQCHHVLGQPVLPGLAYIDLLYQLFREQGYDYTRLELRHLTIFTPLAAPDYPVELRIACVPVSAVHWQITVSGSVQAPGTVPVATRYATAEMLLHEAGPAWPETVAITSWQQEVHESIDIAAAYQIYASQQVVHAGWMKAAGQVSFTDTAVWMSLEVPPEGRDSMAHFMFHPVLIDGSAVGSVLAAYAWANGTQQLFLPLYYASFRASALLQDACITRVRTTDMVAKQELVTLSFTFFNAAGEQVAVLQDFTAKLVRDAALGSAPSFTVPEAIAPETAAAPVQALTYVRALWASRLQRSASQVSIHAGYYEMGLDSAALLDLVSDISRKVQQSLPPTLLFEYTTLTELAAYLTTHYQSVFAFAANSVEAGLLSAPAQVVAAKPENEGIAVLSLAGRFPGAANIAEFWQNLQAGKDSVTTVPDERWDHQAYVDTAGVRPDKTRCQWGGFLADVDKFDALFFHIAPTEAALMDPQERLFLETVWVLLEQAGYTRRMIRERFRSSVGVFAGAMYQQYQLLPSDIIQGSVTALQAFAGIANRVSYYFDFQGPSMGLDTMCSSSLAAIQQACESLRRGECRLAVAGGVNLTLDARKYIGLSIAGLLGSSADSRSFADGDGFLPAEAVGAVLLKPLDDALRDGDTVLAVIRSVAVNHGGNSGGYAVPGVSSQFQLITENIARSGVDPRTISYVEAAANGSALGDAIEVAALTKAFNSYGVPAQSCALGAVKSNIGHAEAASGISQLIKVVLQLRHRTLVPTIKARPLNPKIELSGSPFYLQEELTSWPETAEGIPRRAAITSLGAGGANAHLIIEEHPAVAPERTLPDERPQLLVFSARSQERLQALVRLYIDFLQEQPALALADLAFTLQTGREEMEERLAFVAATLPEVLTILHGYLDAALSSAGTSVAWYSGSVTADPTTDGETADHQLPVSYEALETFARRWVNGSDIAWLQLHGEVLPRKLSLPTYPFEKRRCWLQGTPVTTANFVAEPVTVEVAATGDIREEVTLLIAGLLGITPAELGADVPLYKLGFDSIYTTRLLQQLQARFGIVPDMDRFRQCVTLRDVWAVLPEQVTVVPQIAGSLPIGWQSRRFPELLLMNGVTTGRPVFWIHAVTGGVAVYQHVAAVSKRPFYGIQARGWMSDRTPLQGVQAMAAYYVHMIQSVQPEGPYDLGGYSVGGVLAYEVLRQLQELGEEVNSIVMLDSLYVTDWETPELKLPEDTSLPKLLAFQSVNMMITVSFPDPVEAAQALIHRDVPDWELEEDAFLEQLISIARERGLSKSMSQLQELVRQSVKTQEAYAITDYHFGILPAPERVTCYYFRNRSGEFLGALKPYFALWDQQSEQLGRMNYWEGWEQQFSHMYLVDIDAANHMQLLSDPPAAATILEFCTALYAGGDLSAEFVNTFCAAALAQHGSRAAVVLPV